MSISKLSVSGGMTDIIESTTKNHVNQMAVNETRSYLNKLFPTAEFSLDFFNRDEPNFGILIVAPLSDIENIEDTIFIQTSIYHKTNRTTINLGLGYRKLMMKNTLMLGANMFYDHELPYDHGRLGLGLELKTAVGEITYNQYMKQTNWKSNYNIGSTERALSGYDLEFGMPLPYMNWVTVFGKSFVWDGVDGLYDIRGNDLSVRAQIPSFPGLTIEAIHKTYHGTLKKDQNSLTVEYNLLAMNQQGKKVEWISDSAYMLSDISGKRFDKIRRENLIYKQKKNNGVTTTGY